MKKNFILLRGLSRESRHWNEFPKTFEETDSQVKVHFIELPGAGRRFKEIFPSKTEDILEDVNLQVSTIKNKFAGDYYILTISLGGMIVLKYLEKYPNDFKSAFIINSSAGDLSPFYKRFQFGIWKNALGLVFQKSLFKKEYEILSFTTNHINKEQLDILAKLYADYAHECAMSTRNVFRQLFWASKLKSPKNLSTPLIFISSRGDRLCHFSCGLRLSKKYTGAKLVLHDSAGHDLPLDDRKWVVNVIKEALS